jgi:hypothetical protein
MKVSLRQLKASEIEWESSEKREEECWVLEQVNYSGAFEQSERVDEDGV